MGAFFFNLQMGTFKVLPRKRRRKAKNTVKTTEDIGTTQRGWLQYYGRSWPEVVGLPASEAKMRIERDCPGVYCEIVSMNQMLTMAYCSRRVRLMVDRYGTVIKTPHVG